MNQPYQYHVFVCTNHKWESTTHCADHGSEEVLQELELQLRAFRIEDKVLVTSSGCLGLCTQGPVMVIYPEGTWYTNVQIEDLREIVENHFLGGKVIERLAVQDSNKLGEMIREHRLQKRNRQVARIEAGVLPERLRRLAGDFQASRAFLTAVELDLFSAVDEGCDVSRVAEQIGTDPRATELLLNAMVALRLLCKKEGRYYNTEDTKRYLRKGWPDDARAALMNRVNMWDRFSTLTECVREGGSLGHDVPSGPSATQAYIAATHKIAELAAPALVASLGLDDVKKVLDLGGGSGAYTIAVLRSFQNAKAQLLDLPAVIRIATMYIRKAEMEDRIELKGGNFMFDPLGTGFDLVLMSYITHLISPSANKRLLSKALGALEPGGRLVINDYVLDATRTHPPAAAIYALNMLVSSQGGRVFSFEEYKSWLEDVGFCDVNKIKLVGPTDIVTARRP